jgi:hypothetical protein
MGVLTSRRRKRSRSRLAGTGEGVSYVPWYTVRDGGRIGHKIRPWGFVTGRTHQLLSNLELRVFIALDSDPDIIDIREQFPLSNIDETRWIANQLDVKHPAWRGEDIVMTTDFLITRRVGLSVKHEAIDVKPSTELKKYRVLNKLDIARHYWEARGIPWTIMTERDLDLVFEANINKTRPSRFLTAVNHIPEATFTGIRATLESKLVGDGISLTDAAKYTDAAFQVAEGTSLLVGLHLVATRVWKIDWSKPFSEDARFKSL